MLNRAAQAALLLLSVTATDCIRFRYHTESDIAVDGSTGMRYNDDR